MTQHSPFLFGTRAFILYLAFLNAFVPLSIDLYLPALPSMTRLFSTSDDLAKLTISFFMLFFALSMLVWGPLSDKLGRKKILHAGLVLYIGGSLLCAEAGGIYTLIAGRVIQAIGCGAVQAVSMAIVKDSFTGRTMENVLVWIQTITVLGPMLAPILGGVLLQFTSWRGLFWILLVGGGIGFAGSIALRETLAEPTGTTVLGSLGRIPVVLRHRGLRWLLLLFAFSAMPFMIYLSTSAFIYENMFGTTSQVYSYFFAGNAAFSLLGPLLYIRIFREMPRLLFLGGCFAITGVCGALLMLYGAADIYVFTLLFIPVTLLGSAIRPVGTILMMSQLDTDNGTVASLIGSTGLLFGSGAMLLSSLGWSTPVMAVGTICCGVGALCLALWLAISAHKIFREPA